MASTTSFRIVCSSVGQPVGTAGILPAARSRSAVANAENGTGEPVRGREGFFGVGVKGFAAAGAGVAMTS